MRKQKFEDLSKTKRLDIAITMRRDLGECVEEHAYSSDDFVFADMLAYYIDKLFKEVREEQGLLALHEHCDACEEKRKLTFCHQHALQLKLLEV